ncbi:hypothetical protein GCM10028774_39290 [Spirosoma jeollabukense]
MTNSLVVFAQAIEAEANPGKLVLTVGYLHSLTRVVESPGNLVGISDYYGKPGFYTGLYYEKIFSASFATRSELTYQVKGVMFDAITNGIWYKRTSNFNYLSLRQLFSILRLNHVGVFAGPEINLLTTKRESTLSFTSVEWGVSGCVRYELGRLAINVDYFRALNRFLRSGDNLQYFDLYNDNLRFGVGYNLNKQK